MKRRIITVLAALTLMFSTACDGSYADISQTKETARTLQSNQPTPEDISYSLQRYNLIRRAYWVTGQYDKANNLHCEVERVPGYVYLYAGNTLVASYVVAGQVTSLRTYLTPDSEKYSSPNTTLEWLADVDGTYGENPDGIFFFTQDGEYVEWTGAYLYSTTPIEAQ